jgi:hypothetical protein
MSQRLRVSYLVVVAVLLLFTCQATYAAPGEMPIAQESGLWEYFLSAVAGIAGGFAARSLGKAMSMGSAWGYSPMGFLIGLLAPGIVMAAMLSPRFDAKCDVFYIVAAGITWFAIGRFKHRN